MATAAERVHRMTLASVYPLYIQKVERKGQPAAHVDTVLRWLTGHTPETLQIALDRELTFPEFFDTAPALQPNRSFVTGVICGVRIEEITDPVMREVRILDKLIDEVSKGRPLEKVLRPTP